jgi:hypothetical protein
MTSLSFGTANNGGVSTREQRKFRQTAELRPQRHDFGFALSRQPEQPSETFAAYEEHIRHYVAINLSLLDLTREGPVPDEQMDRAKHAIDLGQIISDYRERWRKHESHEGLAARSLPGNGRT